MDDIKEFVYKVMIMGLEVLVTVKAHKKSQADLVIDLIQSKLNS